MRFLQTLLFIVFTLFIAHSSVAQTNISGTINSYAAVSAISTSGCQSSITVNSTSGFNIGDSAMIIQMKGATIDSVSTTSSFGTISAMNAAGRYEIFAISNITGTQLIFNGTFANTYNVNGKVQVVKIPSYTNANVTAPLTCLPWNGQIGGVLAFFVTNTLTLNSNIDATGKGFRGGNISNNPDGGCGSTSSNFYYDLNQPGGSWITGGAMKGEGIAEVSTLKLAGKGHLANGGGGGNKHNTGGGGGGNFTFGGKGGNELGGCAVNGNGGLGGESISYAASGYKLLVEGGGGGCGDYNNNVGSDGTNGGGIILIKASTIVGNNNSITSNGDDNLILAGGISDGAGGGGAGGTILIHAQNYTGNISIKANGGHGGDQGPGSFYGCAGPGGGGGTGVILVNTNLLPANVTTQTIPGTSGLIQNPTFSCYNTPYGASDGIASAVSFIPNVILQYYTPSVSGLAVNLGNDTILCPGQTMVLNAGGPFASYTWQNLSSNSTFTVTASGTYYVIVTDNSGCIASDTIVVSGVTNAVNLGQDTSLCNGDIIVLSTPFIAGASYLWQDNSNTNSYIVNQAGTYWVEVKISNCTASDTINISYHTPPTVNLGNDTLLCPEQFIVLNASTQNATYLWQDNSTKAMLTAKAGGTYWVEVNVFNCIDRDTIIVGLKDSGCNCNVFIPNAFSPNNDFNNDQFKLVNASGIELLLFSIYNRWGELVYESDNVNDSWNGNFKNKEAENGTYFYQLKYRCKLTREEYFKKGDITLIR